MTPTPLTRLDRATARALSAEIDAAVEKIAAAHGLDLAPVGASFNEYNASFKVVLKVRDDGTGRSADQARFEREAFLHGLEPSDFGRHFIANGKTYTIVGLTNGRKNVVAVTDASGKRYHAPADFVLRGLGRQFAARPLSHNPDELD